MRPDYRRLAIAGQQSAEPIDVGLQGRRTVRRTLEQWGDRHIGTHGLAEMCLEHDRLPNDQASKLSG